MAPERHPGPDTSASSFMGLQLSKLASAPTLLAHKLLVVSSFLGWDQLLHNVLSLIFQSLRQSFQMWWVLSGHQNVSCQRPVHVILDRSFSRA
jgi:hypothetical protein